MVGFDAKNKDKINEINLCRLCDLILKVPVQLWCGHRQCRGCVQKIEGKSIVCPICQQESQREDIHEDKGFRKDMQQLPILCSLCQWNGILKDYEKHIADAHPNPPCEYCGKTFGSTSELDLHKSNECKSITVPCVFKDYGCTNPVARFSMGDHYMTALHQSSAASFLRILQCVPASDSSAVDFRIDVNSVMQTNENHKILLEKSQSLFQQITSVIGTVAADLDPFKEDTQLLKENLSECNERMCMLEQELSEAKKSIEEEGKILSEIQTVQLTIDTDLMAMKRKIEDDAQVSYDGTLIWKICQYREKLAAARSGEQVSYCSRPFYSSPTGYKMCVRLYPNGEGSARNTHMSLFFVLMRSEYDAILKFPFEYNIAFCIYDQKTQKHHIIDRFKPDLKSKSFERPCSEMNAASGIPKFVELTKIEEQNSPYLVDDTIYIKVMVDFLNMPTDALRYTISANPGLKVNVQESLKKEEVVRRTQQTSAVQMGNVK